MAEYRSGYGKATYGSYNYGLDGFITDGAGTIIITTTTAAASVRVRLNASIVVGVSTTSSEVVRVREA